MNLYFYDKEVKTDRTDNLIDPMITRNNSKEAK